MTLTLALGVYVLYRNPQSKINLSFFLFSLSVSLLGFVGYNFAVARTYEVAYFWAVLFFVYHWNTVGQYLFILVITDSWHEIWSKFSVWGVYVPAIIITVLYLISNVLFAKITPVENGWLVARGEGIIPALSDTLMAIWALVLYVIMYRKAFLYARKTFDPIKKVQLRFVFVGVALATIIELIQTIPWIFPEIVVPQTIVSGMTIYLALVTYAIVRYDFFAVNTATIAETVFTTMTDAVFMLSTDMRIKLVNGAALLMIGQVREKVIGRHIDKVVRLSSGRIFSKTLRFRLRRKHEAHFHEASLVHDQDEPARAVSVAALELRSSRGQRRGVILILRDISERKIQENRLRSSYESLKLADQQIRTEVAKLQAIIGSVGEGLIVADPAGSIVLVNQGAIDIMCWQGREILGHNLYEEFVLTSEAGEVYPLQEKIAHAVAKGKSLRISLAELLYITCKKGRRIPIALTTNPIRLGTRDIGTITIFENMTKEVEVDIAKTEFVSLVAHQLATPLSAIRWNLELANANAKPHTDHSKDSPLTLAYEQTAQMLDLVKQFLNVSRLELGKLAIEPEPIDLVTLVRSQIETQRLSSELLKQKLLVRMSKGIPKIPLDPVLTRIVVQNLLSNAIKYTPQKGRITVELRKVRGAVELVVADTGIGIPSSQQDQLFNKLFRAENALARGTEGNGLGLYLVKSIVSLMKGGDITFVSEEGKGTTFTVTIPLQGMEKRQGTRKLAEIKY